jgi:hypothetical protein
LGEEDKRGLKKLKFSCYLILNSKRFFVPSTSPISLLSNDHESYINFVFDVNLQRVWFHVWIRLSWVDPVR